MQSVVCGFPIGRRTLWRVPALTSVGCPPNQQKRHHPQYLLKHTLNLLNPNDQCKTWNALFMWMTLHMNTNSSTQHAPVSNIYTLFIARTGPRYFTISYNLFSFCFFNQSQITMSQQAHWISTIINTIAMIDSITRFTSATKIHLCHYIVSLVAVGTFIEHAFWF